MDIDLLLTLDALLQDRNITHAARGSAQAAGDRRAARHQRDVCAHRV